MIKLQEAIVVEGRYDKNTLSQIVDAPIFETSGFGIMNDRELLVMLRNIAQKRGLIVFTDADGAGLVIRNYLSSAIEPQYLRHAYIPEIPGKERRKSAPGKEGKLGVEGMTPEVIICCLERCGATILNTETITKPQITKMDLFDLGLSGCTDSKRLREKLLKHLGFPTNISTNAMHRALSILYTKEELEKILQEHP